MVTNRPRILVITPVRHISGVSRILESIGSVTYLDDPSLNDVIYYIIDYDAIFTNPNKSKVFIGKKVIDSAKNLKVICTASTGTSHIDKNYAAKRGVAILALTEERAVIQKISSTAELAFSLTLASLRHVVRGHNAVMQGEWDYTRYIGRQMNYLTIGVLGYGRLGSMYVNYCLAFGSRVIVYDPYKTVTIKGVEQYNDICELFSESDIVSVHVHVTPETWEMVNAEKMKCMKHDVVLVNTSRGEIIDEEDLVDFLRKYPKARVATDVLRDENRNRLNSPLLKYAGQSNQVIITPHIGGMSREAQEIAYCHAANMLKRHFGGS